MPEKEFQTPQEALAHYGKKGMHWGVRNDEKPSGSSSGGNGREKPPESSTEALKAASDAVYSKKSAADLKAEGQKKLEAQANSSFPSKGAQRQEKRNAKADVADAQAAEAGKKVAELQAQKDALPPGVRNVFKRQVVAGKIQEAQQVQTHFEKRSADLREGRLTDQQKSMIKLGAAAAVTGLALYGTYKVGDNMMKSQSRDHEANERETSRQWKELFGEDRTFDRSASHLLASQGSFFGGISNKKAYDRPEFEIPEGTIFQRLSNHQEDSREYGKVKGAYATFLNNDKKMYGASSEFGGAKYKVEFEAHGPTKVPSHKTVLAHLKQVYASENPQIYNGQTEAQREARVAQIYHDLAGGSWSNHTSTKLFDSLRSFGYGAIVDDMDAGYLGDLPVVFFGKAKEATSTARTEADKKRDQSGVLKLSGQYA